MLNELITIVMPAYNLEEYIGESIQSIQRQTYRNWELLVVDDGSQDNTVSVVRALMVNDSRIRIITQTNMGAAGARNTGIDNACGKIVAFLDGDDLWKENFLEQMLSAKQAAKVDMVYCGYTHLYRKGITRKFSYRYLNGNILSGVISGKTQVHIGCILIDKEFLDRRGIRFTTGCPIGEDQEFIIRIATEATVESIPEELMLYRIRPGSSITSNWNWEKHLHAILSLKRARDYVLCKARVRQDNDEISREFQQRISYKLFRFLWRMIKHGYHSQAAQLMQDEQYGNDLSGLDRKALSMLDGIKFNIVKSRDMRLWQFVSKIKFI